MVSGFTTVVCTCDNFETVVVYMLNKNTWGVKKV